MPRPKKKRFIGFQPNVHYFKPQGVPLRLLEEVVLEREEIEAIKLYDIDRLEQTMAAEKMKISQPTFARILGKAHQKLAEVVIAGKALRIEE